jgi:hypothetical protein
MNLPNSVRITPVRLFVAALSLLCIPAFGQSVVASPAPSAPVATTPTPAPAPEPIATPAPATPIVADPTPAAAAAPSVTVTATPDAAPAPALDKNAQMAAVQTTMTENMAKAEAANIARRANEDSEQAGTKSDMEMKHAIIAQLQAMSDQIAQLNDRVTALTAQLTPSPAAGKAKPAKAKVSNQPPNPAVAH